MLQTIALEEHYASPTFMKGPGRELLGDDHYTPEIITKLCDVDQQRLADMDAGGIGMQVLSLISPGVEQLDSENSVNLARESNDFLAKAVKRNPARFAGFAALPTSAPSKAADELKRAVRELGFKGALINGHNCGRYLDDAFFWPILECAEALSVPLYIHPTLPPKSVIEAYYTGNHSPRVTARLSKGAWGWHIETAVHVLRLVLSGALDRFPKLQLIVGHLGEALPFMLPRLDRILNTGITGLNRPVASYLCENVFYTLSGFNDTPAFLNLLLRVGADRIMFSTDYPFGSPRSIRDFLEELPTSPADREKIAHINAERLLRL